MLRGLFTLVRKAEAHVVGVHLPPEVVPRLWERVRSIARRLGALEPEHIVVGLDPNFFVTEANVKCLDKELTGRTLFCSLLLSRILTIAELDSIIGHELGHFKGADTTFSEKFYPIYRGTASALQAVAAAAQGGANQLALLPAIAVLSYFMETFAVSERRISRARELAADAEGATVASFLRTAACALVKVHAFAPQWGLLHERILQGLKARSFFLNLSALYAEGVAQVSRPECLRGSRRLTLLTQPILIRRFRSDSKRSGSHSPT